MRNALDAELPARWGLFQRWKNHLLYGVIRISLWGIRAMPFGAARSLAWAVGSLAAIVDRPDRRRALANLDFAFPEMSPAQRHKIFRQMFVHLAISAVEIIHLDRFLRGSKRMELSAANRAVLDHALAQGHGVIAVAGHLGNWELLAQVIAAAGYPISSIASPLYDPRLTRLIHQHRTAFGQQILWRRDAGVPKQMLQVFKDNGVLGLLIDQDTRVRGAFVPFFGRPAHTPTAAASLALRSGATLVVGRIWRERGCHQVELELFEKPSSDVNETVVVDLTARLSAWLEAAIRKHPEQWVWIHDRWKKRPLDSNHPSQS